MKDAVCKICLLAHLNSLGQPSNIKCNFPHHFLLQTSFSPSKVMKLQAFKQNIWNKNHFIRMRMQHQPPTPISSKPKWGVFIALKTIHRRRIPPPQQHPTEEYVVKSISISNKLNMSDNSQHTFSSQVSEYVENYFKK